VTERVALRRDEKPIQFDRRRPGSRHGRWQRLTGFGGSVGRSLPCYGGRVKEDEGRSVKEEVMAVRMENVASRHMHTDGFDPR